jgi:hypothetical protein
MPGPSTVQQAKGRTRRCMMQVDYSDEWSAEDLRDFRQASWEYIDTLTP